MFIRLSNPYRKNINFTFHVIPQVSHWALQGFLMKMLQHDIRDILYVAFIYKDVFLKKLCLMIYYKAWRIK